MLGLAYALMDIHIHGLVHRDLKPSNVLRTPEGHPCVIDFGIAYELGSTRRTQGLIGTPAYAAPELLLGRPITPAADVFSLGGIIVFAASGHQPFGGEHYGQIIQSVINDPPNLDGVPDELIKLVRRCLKKRPSDRPTPDQIIQKLKGEA